MKKKKKDNAAEKMQHVRKEKDTGERTSADRRKRICVIALAVELHPVSPSAPAAISTNKNLFILFPSTEF